MELTAIAKLFGGKAKSESGKHRIYLPADKNGEAYLEYKSANPKWELDGASLKAHSNCHTQNKIWNDKREKEMEKYLRMKIYYSLIALPQYKAFETAPTKPNDSDEIRRRICAERDIVLKDEAEAAERAKERELAAKRKAEKAARKLEAKKGK